MVNIAVLAANIDNIILKNIDSYRYQDWNHAKETEEETPNFLITTWFHLKG